MGHFEELTYNVAFSSPAFLGSAGEGQTAQWRTPPFKALLREWWRIEQANKFNFDCKRLLEAEGQIFGNAASGGDSNQSLVRLRLENWNVGNKRYPSSEFGNCRIETARNPPRSTTAGLYLGYGPVQLEERQARVALEPFSENVLSIQVSDPTGDIAAQVRIAMQFAAWFGTMGSRSRNGWGSVFLKLSDPGYREPRLNMTILAPYTRDYREALKLDWPHAFGRDDRGILIWKTSRNQDWKMVLKELGELRIATRKKCPAIKGQSGLQEKHILAYPLKEPLVTAWGSTERMANQLRFKILWNGNKNEAQFEGLIFHTPHGVPDVLASKLEVSDQRKLAQIQLDVWSKVHGVLDSDGRLKRL